MMDTHKLYVFLFIYITLIFLQTSVDAALGSDCSADSTVCDTSNNEICIGTTCVCDDGFYESGTSCASNNDLKPRNLQLISKTYNSVTLSWTSPAAPGEYTNSYVINYSGPDGTVETHNVNNQDTYTTVPNLNGGTTYTFTVVRSITRQGRKQAVPASDSYPATTYLNYLDTCTTPGTSLECGPGFVCVPVTEKCLCTSRNYFTGTDCISSTNITPSITSTQPTSKTRVTVTWNSPQASGYTNSYVIKYTEGGTTDEKSSPFLGDVSTYIVTGLKAGTSYTFKVVRHITWKGRITTVINSPEVVGTSEKLDYGESCSSKGTCKDPNLNCYSSICRCNPGYFWKDTSCLINANLRPMNVATEALSTTQLRVTWTASAYPGIVTGYLVDLSPPVASENIAIIDTSAIISSLTPGERYSITVSSNSSYLERRETAAAGVVYGITQPAATTAASEAVVDMKVSDPTSRAASVSWKRPLDTKGVLYKYTIELINSSTCVERINIQCEECLQAMNILYISTETTCDRETNTSITESDLNDVNFLVRYDLSLLPDTLYTVIVAAYNEEGKGQMDQDTQYTEQEAPGEPTNFHYVSKTSESIELRWTPPEPRPGVTAYIISVNEWDEDRKEYRSFQNVRTLGFYNVSINVTGLSSYWKYSFEMFARTFKGDSNTTNVPGVTTAESAPTAVENLEHQPVNGVYNQYQLSWRCPPQKDGRNGVIRSATVITSSFIQSGHIRQEIREYNFENYDCNWSEPITVTAEFNYTFEVYISNSIKGVSTKIQRYMPAGPASFLVSERPILQVRSGTETTVGLLVCTTCLLDNTNGLIVKSGVLVCAKGDCPLRNADEVMTADSFDKSPNWDTTAGVGFSTWYRASEDDWLKGKEASDEIRFVLGEESCGVQDQNRFCNGPLPVDRTYRVWLFACTRVSCAEGDHVEFTLGINNADSLSGSIIAGLVIAAVLVVLAAVILVVYIKVIRPRSQRKRSTQYVSDTSPKDDTYAEIGDGNRMSVIKDGQPEVDYYNTTDSPPRSEDTYDQLKVYSNQGQHDYGKIKVTQT